MKEKYLVLSLERNIYAVLTAALIMLVMACVLGWRLDLERHSDEAEARRAREAISTLEETLSTIGEAERGQLGFLLTGDGKYLDLYTSSVSRIQEEIDGLWRLTADDVGRRHLSILERQVGEKLRDLEQAVASRRAQEAEGAPQAVLTERGKRLMDDISRSVATMKQEEESHLAQRSAAFAAGQRQTRLEAISLVGLGFLLLILCAWLLRIEMKAKRRRIAELRREALAFEYFSDSVMITDEKRRIVNWNHAAERLFGYSRQEAIGQTNALIRVPSQATTHSGRLRQSIPFAPGSKPFAGETVRRRRDGETMTCETAITPVYAEDGEMIGLMEINRDISEQKRIEEMMARLAAIVRFSRDAVISFAPDGTILTWNDGAEHIFGYTAWEAVGRHLAILSPDRWRQDGQVFEAVLRGRAVEQWEIERVRKDGRRVRVSITCSPIMNDRGDVVGAAAIMRDITERRNYEAELRRSERRSRSILDSINALILVVAPEGVLTDANRFAIETFGARADEMIGARFIEVFPWRNAAEAQAKLHGAITRARSGEPAHFDLELRGPGGGTLVVDFTLTPIFDDLGEVEALIAFGTDVTAHKHTERRLREREERYRTIFDSVGVSLWEEDFSGVLALLGELRKKGVTDFAAYFDEHPETVAEAAQRVRLLDANAESLKLFGARGKEELPDSVNRMFTPDSFVVFRHGLEAIAAGERRFAAEAQVQTLQGERREVMLTLFLPESDSAADRALLSLTDITERKQAEALLRESEERLRLATQTTGLGAYDYDVRTGEQYWSPELRALCGLPADSQISIASLLELIDPDDRDRIVQTFQSCLDPAGTGEFDEEFRIRRDDGQTRWLHVKGRTFFTEVNGVRSAFRHIGAAHDITERREAEAERERLLQQEHVAREEAEAAVRAKDEFLALVSHELRAPLNAILGWSGILRGQPTPETILKATQTIESSARAQQRLIEDILDATRIITGKLRLTVESISFSHVINEAISVMRPAMEAKQISLDVRLSREADAISGDAHRLQQVIWNLLSNAVKFTPQGGAVSIRLERADPYARLIVTDTGSGIKPEALPHIFDRFRQDDSRAGRRSGGLGLGLSLVKYLVELHGGTVRAASEGEGRGATFAVNLPLRAVLKEGESRRAGESETGVLFDREGQSSSFQALPLSDSPLLLEGVRALVVDDEEDARRLVAYTLERYGAIVTVAASGMEAIETFTRAPANERFDVIVCDIGMPDFDGYDVVRRVRSLPAEQGGRAPMVALTAYSHRDDRVRTLAAGFQMHLAKPVEPAELVLTIAALLSRLKGA